MSRTLLVIALIVPLAAYSQKIPKQAEVKVQKASLSRDQEVQIGKQFAGQVEREMEVIHNPEIEKWLNQIGQNLAKTPQASVAPQGLQYAGAELATHDNAQVQKFLGDAVQAVITGKSTIAVALKAAQQQADQLLSQFPD